MSEINKYKDLPKVLLPQIREQCISRVRALEEVITTQQAALDEGLKSVYSQLEEAKADLKRAEEMIDA
jgi:hypothetical protein